MIACLPVPVPAQRPVRMVFLASGPGAGSAWQAWADRLGPAVDGRIAAPEAAGADLAGPGRPVPTVLVAAGGLVAAALDLCRRVEQPPELLVIAPGPGATPGPEGPVAVPLAVLACEGQDPREATGWRQASTRQTVVRLLPASPAGLVAPQSPAVPALAAMLRISTTWFAAAAAGGRP